MIIPVRVRADATITTAMEPRPLTEGHPLRNQSCPVCEQLLAGEPVTLVLVGFHPDDRKDSGWTTGIAVAVHAACTNPHHEGGEDR